MLLGAQSITSVLPVTWYCQPACPQTMMQYWREVSLPLTRIVEIWGGQEGVSGWGEGQESLTSGWGPVMASTVRFYSWQRPGQLNMGLLESLSENSPRSPIACRGSFPREREQMSPCPWETPAVAPLLLDAAVAFWQFWIQLPVRGRTSSFSRHSLPVKIPSMLCKQCITGGHIWVRNTQF